MNLSQSKRNRNQLGFSECCNMISSEKIASALKRPFSIALIIKNCVVENLVS